MKKIAVILLLAIFTSCNKSDDGTTVNNTPNSTEDVKTGKATNNIDVNGTSRDYITYVPSTYSSTKSYPLLFAFHGLGGNMESSYNNSKFHELAESENFIVVHPNGLKKQWNAVTVENNIDIAFVNQMITKLKSNYNIDANRIYSSGMSNGGYFSFVLACELSDKIAAIGSVTGLMFKSVLDNCTPKNPVPVIQIHGTEDSVVDYNNVENVINFWNTHNKTNSTPVVSQIPDTDTTDGSTVERFTYKDGTDNVEVQHLKITGGGHDWPGYEGNMDINASEEVWNFVKNYDINGKIN